MEPNHLGTLLYFSSETLCSSNLSEVREHIRTMYMVELKGILPQNSFYRPNLKFWIVMGCGKARFGQKRHLKLKILVSQFVLWDLEATRTDHCRLPRGLMCGLPRGPSDQKSFTTPHYYPKYEGWAIKNFLL